jgi:hypothetical protein
MVLISFILNTCIKNLYPKLIGYIFCGKPNGKEEMIPIWRKCFNMNINMRGISNNRYINCLFNPFPENSFWVLGIWITILKYQFMGICSASMPQFCKLDAVLFSSSWKAQSSQLCYSIFYNLNNVIVKSSNMKDIPLNGYHIGQVH